MINTEFIAQRVDNKQWIKGCFCQFQFHEEGLFFPCIQVLREWDTGDYLEYHEIITESLYQEKKIIKK